MLAERVAAGELPPVDERLPVNPSLYPVPESIGKYGGTLRRGHRGMADQLAATKVREVGMVHYNENLSLRPDLAESWELSEDARTITWHLRPGIRWSDGELFTAKDFAWFFEHVTLNTDLTPAQADNPWSIETPDDATVVQTFERPYPLVPYFSNRGWRYTPSHYMSQWHIDTAEDKDALQATVTEMGFSTWMDLYLYKDTWYNNPERPDVAYWLAQNTLADEVFVMERNPYFFGVDAEGQQLPYVDQVNHRLFESQDVFNMWILSGEIDWQCRHVNVADYTMLKDGEAKGGYQVKMWKTDYGETLCPNHGAKDPRLRELFANVLVRRAMNVAMDREAINEIAFDGLAVGRQSSPGPGPHYHEKATQAYAYYDPDQANEWLDEAGFTERDAEGYRKWNDGSGDTVFFVIEGVAPAGTYTADTVEMVVKYLADVGIKTMFNNMERSYYTTRANANEHEAHWRGAGHYVLEYLRSSVFYIGELLDRNWAGAWGIYKKRGPDDPAAEPPPEGHFLWRWWELFDAGRESADEAFRHRQLELILDEWAELVPVVGLIGEIPGPLICNNGVRNVPDSAYYADRTKDESLFGPAIIYWEDPAASA